jgi:hypothetical protein
MHAEFHSVGSSQYEYSHPPIKANEASELGDLPSDLLYSAGRDIANFHTKTPVNHGELLIKLPIDRSRFSKYCLLSNLQADG